MQKIKKLSNVFVFSIIIFSNFASAIQYPSRSEIVLTWTNLTWDISNNKPIINSPTKSTIFVNDAKINTEIHNSDDIYYSSNDQNFDIWVAKKNLENIDLWIAEINDKIIKLDKKHTSTDDKYKQTRYEVVSVIQNIEENKKKLENNIKNISNYQKLIWISSNKITLIQKDIKKVKSYIQDFVVAIQKVNNQIYWENGNIDNIKLFVNSNDNIAYKLSQSQILKSMTASLWNLIDNMKEEEKKQIKRIKLSNSNRTDLREQIKEYNLKIQNLEQKRKYLSEYLDIYEANKNKIEGKVTNIFDTRKDAISAILGVIEEIKAEKYVADFDVKQKIKELENMEQYATYERSSPFSRPLYPINYISSHFKDDDYKDKYWIQQYGIEIPAPQMSPLYATNDWIVYKINYSDDMSVSRIIILHKNKSMSVYLFPNNIFVQNGDIIRRWQIIWYSWWEPWTRWAWFVSKSPNLTFMIILNWKFVDPLSVLDLSAMTNKSLLPHKYHIKYLQDLYRRPRDIYKIEFAKWETLNQRRVDFLERYWVGIYRELAFWQDASENSNIDLDVGICVAFAESTLWKYLSTPNNIWNVWNNDRWDRISFGSALQWAKLIYSTMNNQYLGKYNSLIELNWYGNKKWAIYASSPYNRQNNVIKCLSQIKWYFVPDDYPFRIWKNIETTKNLAETWLGKKVK